MGRAGYFGDDTANESGQVELYLQYTSLVTGGIPTTLSRSSGFGLGAVAAIARTGVGLFTIQFDQIWTLKYLDFNGVFQQAAYSAAGACEVQILTDTVATNGQMTIEVTNAAGAAVDPTTNDIITYHWTMQSHTAGY